MSELDAAGVVAGARIAGYLLEQEVGQGATGVVFRARDEQRGQPVALKIMRPPLAADREFAGRLLREAPAVAAVGEPHILPALQVGEADGTLFVCMPFVNGTDARSMVRREGALPPQRVAPIVWRVASALDAAHAAGHVHGDVKPTNVLVESRPGQPDLVYLSDFGQGRPAASAQAGAALDCLAPEQAEGKQADARADQYALACVAFELLTGLPPLRHDEPAAPLTSRPAPPRASSLRPGLPPAVDGVLGRALAQVAAYRYRNCGDFANALHDALWGDSGPGQPTAVTVADSGPAVPDPAWPATAAGPGVPAPVVSGPVLVGAGSLSQDVPFPGSSGPVPPGGGAYPGLAPGATPPGPGLPGTEAWIIHDQRRRRFPILPVAVAAVAVVVVAGLVAGLLVALHGGRSTPKPTALRIAATSGTKPETGYVWTVYSGGNLAGAQIRGDVKGAVSGEVARLYAQQFPFKNAPARVDAPAGLQPTGTAGTASYSFAVRPSLATRYRVEVFESKAAKVALARTATTTVYVASGFSPTSSLAPCRRPVCQETISSDVAVPASAMDTEISKQVYVYFAVNLVKSGTAPKPTVLQLYGGGATVKVKLLSATLYQVTVGFRFTIGTTDGYNWDWDACSKDTEAQDGIGLPGSHGCGDNTIPSQVNYIG
jgi:serine/threonine-protein kinase